MQSCAARLLELDCGRLIPNNVFRSQPVNQHQHVNGIDRGIHAATKDRPDIIARAPGKRQFQSHLAPILRDVLQAPARSAITAENVKRPAAKLVGDGCAHSHRKRDRSNQPLCPSAPAPASEELADRYPLVFNFPSMWWTNSEISP